MRTGCKPLLRAPFIKAPLDQVTPKRIVEYKNKRYADGVMPATINRELTTLKKAFNLARREWEWCSDNPVTRVSMEKENNARDRWLTRHEQARLLALAAEWLEDIVIFASTLDFAWERALRSHGGQLIFPDGR